MKWSSSESNTSKSKWRKETTISENSIKINKPGEGLVAEGGWFETKRRFNQMVFKPFGEYHIILLFVCRMSEGSNMRILEQY